MNYALFFVYLALSCWLLTRIKFIRTTGLANKTIILLFLLRILAGVVNGYINLYYYHETDSSLFHLQGIAEYHLLFNDPKEYFLNIFHSNYHDSYTRLFDTTDSFWNDLRSNLIAKLLSVFNIFSRCNYFINIIFYNFLVFFGSAGLYKIFTHIFPGKKNTLIICLFLLPSFVYSTSGIHKDGLIFLGLGIVCFNLNYILRNGVTAKRLLYISGGLVLIFLIRNFVFLMLIPALVAWILAEKRKYFFLQTFVITYFLFGILFFFTGFLHSKLNLPHYVSERQIEFVGISKSSGSAINVNPLFPNFRSFLNNTPQAINHSLMRPYITESSRLLIIPAALEILFYEILLLLFFLFRSKKSTDHAFLYFVFFFSLSMYLLIGYTIPILGAIVRYRSVYWPFFITPIACFIDWNVLLRKHIQK
ncbi:MAG TPA: hypothetical protein VN958_02715 [Chitinophagaceae bacterium]|nr:hypothetical protein [Chitinophagaceae bacterium]